MTLSPRWKDAEFLLITALYNVDKGLANSTICVTAPAQALQSQPVTSASASSLQQGNATAWNPSASPLQQEYGNV